MTDCPDCCGPKDTDATHTFCTRRKRTREDDTSVCFHGSCPDHRCNQGMISRAVADGHAGARYRTIVADPPWQITMHMGAGGRRARATEVPYSMLDLAAIEAFPVASLAEDEAHLFMWTTRHLFREGAAARVARAWGFEPCGEVIWGLRNPGMGGIMGNGHEPVLIASRGGLPFPKDMLPCGVHFWKQPYGTGKNTGKIHSAKPDAFLDWVEQVSPGPYLELFARRARFGWSYWGDESLGTAEMAA